LDQPTEEGVNTGLNQTARSLISLHQVFQSH
jgi:hypothetical protein